MEICGYKVVKRLSTSEFSDVYLLEDSIVAKVPKHKDQDFIKRINYEAEILKDLQGLDSIVKLIGTCEWNGLPVILMEYIDGLDLYEYINTYGPLKGYDKILFAEKLLDILKRIHGRGYVLRDLKPNHIIFRHGRVHDIVLIDFGCSYRHGQTVGPIDRRISSGSYTHPHLEKYGGSFYYYDLYSYGAVLLFAFTGKDPMLASPEEAGLLEDLVRACLDPKRSEELGSALNINIPDRVTIELEDRRIEVKIGKVVIGRVGKDDVYIVSDSEHIWLCKDIDMFISRLDEGGHVAIDFINMKIIRLSRINKPAVYRNGIWIPVKHEMQIKPDDKIALAYGEKSDRSYLIIKVKIKFKLIFYEFTKI